MTLVYQSRWQSRISFYLPLTSFTKQECEHLMAAIYPAMLSKMGYNCHIPKVVRYGPKRYGGAGMIHMYTEQGLKHLQHLLGNLRQQHELSDIIKITFSNYQFHLGIETFFLNTDITKFPYHVTGRIAFLWDFCNQYNITFNFPEVWLPSSNIEHDRNLMDVFTNIKKLSSHNLQIIHACCLYLQVTYLSDIVTPDGLSIREDILSPPSTYEPNYKPSSILEWPYQIRPTKEAFETWRRMLLYYFCVQPDSYIRRPNQTSTTLRYPLRLKRISNPLPTISPKFFGDIIATLPQPNRDSLQYLEYKEDVIKHLYSSLLCGKLCGASDGLVKKYGSYGFLLCDTDEEFHLNGMGLVPRTTTQTTSQRAEFYRGLALASLLKALWIWGGRTDVILELPVWIDNQHVIDTNPIAQHKQGIKSHTQEDYDLWELTRKTLSDIPFIIDWLWVKGHQDEKTDYEDLPFEARLNVQANDLANQAHQILDEPPIYSFLPSMPTILINDKVMSHSSMRLPLYESVHGDDLLGYMHESYGWTKEVLSYIDWDSFNLCYGKHTIHKMTNIVKYLHGWQYAGRKQQQIRESKIKSKRNKLTNKEEQLLEVRKATLCPAGCGQLEQQHHYLVCTALKWTPIIEDEWKTLSSRLKSMKTSPTIISIIMHALTHKYDTTNTRWPPCASSSDSIAYAASFQQQQIGWENMLKGRLSKKWTLAQTQYLLENGPFPKGTLEIWKTAFLPTLVKFGLDLWEKRNEIVHGKTRTENQLIQRKRILLLVKKKYREGQKSVGPAQKRLFYKPEVLRIRSTLRSLKNWLKSVTIAQEVQAKQLLNLRRSMKSFKTYGFTKLPPRQRPQRQRATGDGNIKKPVRRYQISMRAYLISHPHVRFKE